MSNEVEKKQKLNEIIIGYRKVIHDKYEFDNVKKRLDLPKSFDEKRVGLFRNYFLNYLYPLPQKREELNEAFNHLDNYIKQPEKLLRILLDSTSLLFRHGRHLPKILKAGISALRSFRTANKFEGKLVERAIAMQLDAPYNSADIDKLIKSLSRKELEEFIESSQVLFETLHDRVLVGKVIIIVEHLIKKMKQRPNIYSSAEVRGLEIGYEIIKEGNLLFDQLSKEEQEKIFVFIVKMEREVLNEIFSEE